MCLEVRVSFNSNTNTIIKLIVAFGSNQSVGCDGTSIYILKLCSINFKTCTNSF